MHGQYDDTRAGSTTVCGKPKSREVNVRVYFSKPAAIEVMEGGSRGYERRGGENSWIGLPESEEAEDIVEPSEASREGVMLGEVGVEVSSWYENWIERVCGSALNEGGAEEVLDLDMSKRISRIRFTVL